MSAMQQEGLEILPAPLRSSVGRYWEQLRDHPEYSGSSLAALLENDPAFATELSRVWAASEFVAHACLRQPALILHAWSSREVTAPDYFTALSDSLAELAPQGFKAGAETLKKRLREFHRREFIAILWRDYCAYLDVNQVCQQMSLLADACIRCSLAVLDPWSSREWGTPTAEGARQTLLVIGMGKLGANELNVSSDVDLIFAYPEAGDCVLDDAAQEPLSNQQYFTRLGQRLIDTLDTVTADGFAFRVDMRLRPYGSEGALVLNFEAMEDYYQNQGRDWERYALIKARIVAGDPVAGRRLLEQLRPFVYRRYLDFAMFESLRDMKVQINKQARREKLNADIKLGPGGIREVEFIVQALQLVHGGRDRSLQHPSLLRTMDQLIANNYLPATTVNELRDAYTYLRKLEHRLQALHNQQTQKLPDAAADRSRVAFAMGHDDWQALTDCLQQHRETVSRHFRLVLHTEQESPAQQQGQQDWLPLWKQELAEPEAAKFLTAQGYEDAAGSLALLRDFRADRKFLVLPPESRRRIDVFMPLLLHEVAQSTQPSLCLSRVMPLIEAVSRRTAYLVLLLENPGALQQLIVYCTASPLISEYLCKFPVLLDELLEALDRPPEKSVLADELRLQLLRVEANNLEDQLECLRYFKQSHLLQVAAADVSGKMPLMKVSDYLTFTAEVILESVLSLSWQYLVERHGYPVHVSGQYGEPEFAIIGYGKLGGLELSYNSDLDVVFLHRADLEADTITDRESQTSINSRAFYIKLAQRIMVFLGTYTMSGKLYEVDLRLRPSGESGLLVSSLESFAEYQLAAAWTWEHQALVRARGVAGNVELIGEFSQVRNRILSRRRDIKALAGEVVGMRDRMRAELTSNASGSEEKSAFGIKQGSGGIVDIEFLVQYLVLAHAVNCPRLLTFTDNYRILEAARECNLLKAEDMQVLIEAYLELRKVSHQLALQQPDTASSMAQLESTQARVEKIWQSIFSSADQSAN